MSRQAANEEQPGSAASQLLCVHPTTTSASYETWSCIASRSELSVFRSHIPGLLDLVHVRGRHTSHCIQSSVALCKTERDVMVVWTTADGAACRSRLQTEPPPNIASRSSKLSPVRAGIVRPRPSPGGGDHDNREAAELSTSLSIASTGSESFPLRRPGQSQDAGETSTPVAAACWLGPDECVVGWQAGGGAKCWLPTAGRGTRGAGGGVTSAQVSPLPMPPGHDTSPLQLVSLALVRPAPTGAPPLGPAVLLGAAADGSIVAWEARGPTRCLAAGRVQGADGRGAGQEAQIRMSGAQIAGVWAGRGRLEARVRWVLAGGAGGGSGSRDDECVVVLQQLGGQPSWQMSVTSEARTSCLQPPQLPAGLRGVCGAPNPMRLVAAAAGTGGSAHSSHGAPVSLWAVSLQGQAGWSGDVPQGAALPPWGLWGAHKVSLGGAGRQHVLAGVEVPVLSGAGMGMGVGMERGAGAGSAIPGAMLVGLNPGAGVAVGGLVSGGLLGGAEGDGEGPGRWRHGADGAALGMLLPSRVGNGPGVGLQGEAPIVGALALLWGELRALGARVDCRAAGALCLGLAGGSGPARQRGVDAGEAGGMESVPAAKKARGAGHRGASRGGDSPAGPLYAWVDRIESEMRAVLGHMGEGGGEGGVGCLTVDRSDACIASLLPRENPRSTRGLAARRALLGLLASAVHGSLRKVLGRGLAAVLRAAVGGDLRGALAEGASAGVGAGSASGRDRARGHPSGAGSGLSLESAWGRVSPSGASVLGQWRAVPLSVRAGVRAAGAAACTEGARAVRRWRGGSPHPEGHAMLVGGAALQGTGEGTGEGMNWGEGRQAGEHRDQEGSVLSVSEWGLLGWDGVLRGQEAGDAGVRGGGWGAVASAARNGRGQAGVPDPEGARWGALATLLCWGNWAGESAGGLARGARSAGGGVGGGAGGFDGAGEGASGASGMGGGESGGLGLELGLGEGGLGEERKEGEGAGEQEGPLQEEAGMLGEGEESARELGMAVAMAVAGARECGVGPKEAGREDWLAVCGARLSEGSLLVRRAAWAAIACMQSRQQLLGQGPKGLAIVPGASGVFVVGTADGQVVPASVGQEHPVDGSVRETVCGPLVHLWNRTTASVVRAAALGARALSSAGSIPGVEEACRALEAAGAAMDPSGDGLRDAGTASQGTREQDPHDTPTALALARCTTGPVLPPGAGTGSREQRGRDDSLLALALAPVPAGAVRSVLQGASAPGLEVGAWTRGAAAGGWSGAAALRRAWACGLAPWVGEGQGQGQSQGGRPGSQAGLLPENDECMVSVTSAARVLLGPDATESQILDLVRASAGWALAPASADGGGHGASAMPWPASTPWAIRCVCALGSGMARGALEGAVKAGSEPGVVAHCGFLCSLGRALEEGGGGGGDVSELGAGWACGMGGEQERCTALWRCASACQSLGLVGAAGALCGALAGRIRRGGQRPPWGARGAALVAGALAAGGSVGAAWSVVQLHAEHGTGGQDQSHGKEEEGEGDGEGDEGDDDLPAPLGALVDALVQRGALRDLAALPLGTSALQAVARRVGWRGGGASPEGGARGIEIGCALLLRARDKKGAASAAWGLAASAAVRGATQLRGVAGGARGGAREAGLHRSAASLQEAGRMASLATACLRAEPDARRRWVPHGGRVLDRSELRFLSAALEAMGRCVQAASEHVDGAGGQRGNGGAGGQVTAADAAAAAGEARAIVGMCPVEWSSPGAVHGGSIPVDVLLSQCIRLGQLPAGERVAAAAAAWREAGACQEGRAVAGEGGAGRRGLGPSGSAARGQELRVTRAAAMLAWDRARDEGAGRRGAMQRAAAAAVPAVQRDSVGLHAGGRAAGVDASRGAGRQDPGGLARVLVRVGRPAEALSALLGSVPASLIEMRGSVTSASMPQGALDEALQAAEAVELLGADRGVAASVRAARGAVLARLHDAGWAAAEGAAERQAAHAAGMQPGVVQGAMEREGEGRGGGAGGVRLGEGCQASAGGARAAALALRPRAGLGVSGGTGLLRGYARKQAVSRGGGEGGASAARLAALAAAVRARPSADLPRELVG